MTALELLIITALVLASAFMAASEIALFSLSRFQLRSLKERARSAHRKLRKLLSDPGGLLITLLVVNEILNVAISTLITRGVAHSIGESRIALFHLPAWAVHALLGTLISAPVVLLACEVTPKTVAARANLLIAPLVVDTISIIYDICKPIRALLKRLVSAVGGKNEEETLKESDFLLMVEEGHKEGAVQASELELIKKVFEFDDTTVADMLTPLSQVRSLPVNMTIREALTAMRTQRFSRIPVTGETKRDVVGILYSKDLLRAKLEGDQLQIPISEIMLNPVYVLPTMKLNSLFRRLKQQKTHMAIVQNHAGDALGIITMNDVIATLFEDLFPEEEEEA